MNSASATVEVGAQFWLCSGDSPDGVHGPDAGRSPAIVESPVESDSNQLDVGVRSS